nr:MAG TPA: hypothetical protein [Caudoviricetes sp.]
MLICKSLKCKIPIIISPQLLNYTIIYICFQQERMFDIFINKCYNYPINR